MTKKELESENDKLRKAILGLVYHDKGKWFVGLHGETDVTEIVGDLLKNSPR